MIPDFIRILIIAILSISCIITDYKYRIISNVVVVPAMLLGLLFHFYNHGWHGLLLSFLGLLTGAGLFFLFYLKGGMGAGDVKMMMAVGALLGFQKIFFALFLVSLTGGVMAIGMIIKYYLDRHKYAEQSDQTGQKQKDLKTQSPLKISLPYGIAIGIGTIATLFIQ